MALAHFLHWCGNFAFWVFIDFSCLSEPFRVPYAGKLTDALFDKTGTITTDQLQVVGVASYGSDNDIVSVPAEALVIVV